MQRFRGMALRRRNSCGAIALVRVFALVLVAAATQRARAAPPTKFLLDGHVGLGVPIADSDYTSSFYLAPDFGLALGAEIWVRPKLGLAPELMLDGGPLVGHSTGVTTGRFRFRPGLRLLFPFGQGHAAFARLLIGGEMFVYGPGGRQGSGTINTGFATEPGGGMQFKIADRAVVGFTAGFPIGVHVFNGVTTSTNVDFEVTGFVGYRR